LGLSRMSASMRWLAKMSQVESITRASIPSKACSRLAEEARKLARRLLIAFVVVVGC
jgi:hypothetical protein